MKRGILFFLINLIGLSVIAQESAEKIKKNRDITLQEIEYANKLLLETKGKTQESLHEINLINHKLNKRKEFLLGVELEVNMISSVMEDNIDSAAAIQAEIIKLKKIYGLLVYNLYKNRSANYRIMYFLASENLNQLYKRIRIIKIYNRYLKSRRVQMEALISNLLERNKELALLRDEKDLLVKSAKRESDIIAREVNEKKKLVAQLKKKQREIEQEIKEKEKTARKLENELKKIIDEERRKIKASGLKDFMTPEEKIISSDFEKNAGRLPWPTIRGIITGKYGEHQHPDYKSVTIRNDGIYISTGKGEIARSIFKGIVSRVFTIPGENYTVIIKHGDYYTLYHNLINVKIKAGQSINTKDVIGTIFTNETTKETILYFQIWKETEKRDPELWLAH